MDAKHCLQHWEILWCLKKTRLMMRQAFFSHKWLHSHQSCTYQWTEILSKQCFSLMASEWDSTFRNIYEANEFQISIGLDALWHLFDHLGKSCFEFGPFCSERVASPTLERSRPLLLQLLWFVHICIYMCIYIYFQTCICVCADVYWLLANCRNTVTR